MSELINKLVDQTANDIPGVYSLVYEDNKTGVEFTEEALKHFAELIIKECAEVAADHDALDIYEEIREHFGIKS